MKKRLVDFFTTSRLIGILVLLICIIAYLSEKGGVVLLFIAGLIIMFSSKRTASVSLERLTSSVFNYKVLFITALFDALFWLVVLFAGYFTHWLLQKKTLAIQSATTFSKQMLTDPNLTSQGAIHLQSFFVLMVASLILLAFFSVVIYTFSRAFIWTAISNKKLNRHFFVKFFGLNVLWVLILSPLFIFTVASAKTISQAKPVFMLLFIPLFYFTPIIHVFFCSYFEGCKEYDSRCWLGYCSFL